MVRQRDRKEEYGKVEETVKGDTDRILEDIEKELKRREIEERASENERLEPFYLVGKDGNLTRPLHAKIADKVVEEHKVMFLDRFPRYYENGVYKPDEDGRNIQQFIKMHLLPKDKNATTTEKILKEMQNRPELNFSQDDDKGLSMPNQYPKHWINFKNGMLDVKTLTMHEHSPAYYSINQIPHNYDANAVYKDTVADEFIKGIIPDDEDRLMLQRFVGYSMTIQNNLRKAMIIAGMPKTGKSTLMDFITDAIGASNVSSLPIHLLGVKFQSVTLIGKTINISPDASKKMLDDNSVFKQITGNDYIAMEYKGGKTFKAKVYSKMYVVCNELPPVNGDTTGAFFDRLLMLRVDKKGKHIDNLKENLKKSIHGFISECVEKYHDFLVSGLNNIASTHSMQLVREYLHDNDTVQTFLDECTEKVHGKKIKKTDLYRYYEEYCNDCELLPLEKKDFYSSIKAKGYPIHKISVEFVLNISLLRNEQGKGFEQMELKDTPFNEVFNEKGKKGNNIINSLK